MIELFFIGSLAAIGLLIIALFWDFYIRLSK